MKIAIYAITFWLGILVILTPMTLWYGPLAEAAWLPVLSNPEGDVVRDGNQLTFTIEVDKRRFCRLATFNWQATRTGANGALEVMPIKVILQNLNEVFTGTLPAGRIRVGPYVTELPGYFADATAIQAIDFFDCHPGWLTPAIFGPIPIPPPA